ncbi:MAG: hypothetical protein EHM35_06390 [Planctomycetaceae bacterium]|nr:MAG: hypothetical protein EHM35_06390 [Planctomycetaceae bacterium]
MKTQRGLVGVAVTVTVASMCVAALAELQVFSIAAGVRSPVSGLRLALYAVGAVGVIILGAAHFRLAGVVTSIARQLARQGSGPSGEVRLAGPNAL